MHLSEFSCAIVQLLLGLQVFANMFSSGSTAFTADEMWELSSLKTTFTFRTTLPACPLPTQLSALLSLESLVCKTTYSILKRNRGALNSRFPLGKFPGNRDCVLCKFPVFIVSIAVFSMFCAHFYWTGMSHQIAVYFSILESKLSTCFCTSYVLESNHEIFFLFTSYFPFHRC